jgi:hypothetical protein
MTNDVKIFLIGLAGTILAFTSKADGGKSVTDTNRISIYEVAFQCPAAPTMGCGSHAKPVLLQLEHQESVSEAWLNHAGTRLAVVWKGGTNQKDRAQTAESILKNEGASELKDQDREKTLTDFLSIKGWYRGTNVDQLSGEEARIIAGRLLRKVRTLITLTDEKARALQDGFTDAIRLRLTGELPDRSSAEEAVLKVCRQQLTANDIAILRNALKDFHPGRDE